MANEVTPEPKLSTEAQVFRDAEPWEAWPIIIDGVTEYHILNYEYEITTGVDITFSDFSDVVTRWYFFQPCETASDSFDATNMVNYLEAADDEGVHVLVPLPFLGSLSYICDDGAVVSPPGDGDGDPGPDELWDETETIQIPLNKNQLSSAFTSYWATRAASYISTILTNDPDDIVWGWRVIEELRTWVPAEMEFALTVRDTVNTADGTRPMISYTGGAYMPGADILWTLAEKGDGGSSNPETYEVDPATPVARVATNEIISAYYSKNITFERGVGGYMIQMFDHVASGAYMDLWFGDRNDLNRIWSYHRIRLGREALDNLAEVYAANEVEAQISQNPPAHKLFHMPGLTGGYHASGITDDGDETAETARHDLWSGVHEASGIFIYNFGYRGTAQTVWDQYIRALYLIKQEMRPYLATGTKSKPTLTHNGTETDVGGDFYLLLDEAWDSHDHLAMPSYSPFTQTLFRIDDIGYLIVTNSYEQAADIQVTFPDCIDDVQAVSGSGAELGWLNDDLFDEFDGIDGRVYKITFEDCP